MKLTGAQILMEVLKEEGVDTIFGYPGGAVIDIYDELPRRISITYWFVTNRAPCMRLTVIHGPPARLACVW